MAGLGCALALRRAGIDDVVVYERETRTGTTDRVGHGLILMENGVHALRMLGVAHLLHGSTPLTRAILQDEHGVTTRTDRFRDVYCTTRASLVDGLRAQLPRDLLVFNRRCTRVELRSTRGGLAIQAVHFTSGPPLLEDAMDVFVGAEGWRSPLRSALNPSLEQPISRVKEIVTSTYLPHLAAQLQSCFVKTVLSDRGAAFGLLAPTDTRVIGFLQFDSDRYEPPSLSATATDIRYFLEDVLRGAPEPVPTYLRHADLETAHLWDPVNADVPPGLHCHNAVLIGDAAHPLLPFTSQGASAALEDAIVLSDVLRMIGTDRKLIPAALAEFGARRRGDVSAYVQGGRRILASFLDPSSGPTLPYMRAMSEKLVSNS